MGKLGLQGVDLLPASLLCSQGNAQLAGVNHQAALWRTVSEPASWSRLPGPAEAWCPAPTGTGGGSAPSPTAICTGKLCHLPRYKQKRWISGKTGGSFRNKCCFWAAPCSHCSLHPASSPCAASKLLVGSRRDMIPTPQLQMTFPPQRFISNYHRGSCNKLSSLTILFTCSHLTLVFLGFERCEVVRVHVIWVSLSKLCLSHWTYGQTLFTENKVGWSKMCS